MDKDSSSCNKSTLQLCLVKTGEPDPKGQNGSKTDTAGPLYSRAYTQLVEHQLFPVSGTGGQLVVVCVSFCLEARANSQFYRGSAKAPMHALSYW